MTRILPVRLASGSRPLWFELIDFEVEKGQAVLVNTARGTELGYADTEAFEATEEQLEPVKNTLKEVKCLATQADIDQYEQMKERSAAALPIFRRIVAEQGVAMHPVSVEYLFEGDKAIFYFDAEDRVDFRDLVRILASEFRIRVDMRQIGPRDEARIVGGIGHCGQELCCKRLGGELCPVSIRMAKEQDLSLNPAKISGVCGRLMCCLRYEYDAYKDFKSRAPKLGASVHTPEGVCKVCELDVPREVITIQTPDDKKIKIALEDMGFSDPDAAKPDTISADVWELVNNTDPMSMMAAHDFLTSQFTSEDKLGSNKVSYRRSSGSNPTKGNSATDAASASDKHVKTNRKAQTAKQELTAQPVVRKSRRRSTQISADGSVETLTRAQLAEEQTQEQTGAARAERDVRAQRPERAGKEQAAQKSEQAKSSREVGQKRVVRMDRTANVSAADKSKAELSKNDARAGKQVEELAKQGAESATEKASGSRRRRRGSSRVIASGAEAAPVVSGKQNAKAVNVKQADSARGSQAGNESRSQQPRRRMTVQTSASAAQQGKPQVSAASQAQASQTRPRPGQNSSALRANQQRVDLEKSRENAAMGKKARLNSGNNNNNNGNNNSNNQASRAAANQNSDTAQQSKQQKRRPRRRTHKTNHNSEQ